MQISRNNLFLILLFLIVIPVVGPRWYWLAHSKQVTGHVSFTGKDQAGQLMHTYAVVQFNYQDSLYWFNGPDNILYKDDTPIQVYFDPKDPSDARLGSFLALWGDLLVYGGLPVLFLVIVYFQRDLLPRGFSPAPARSK